MVAGRNIVNDAGAPLIFSRAVISTCTNRSSSAIRALCVQIQSRPPFCSSPLLSPRLGGRGSVRISTARLRTTDCATTRSSSSAALWVVKACSRISARAARLKTDSATSISIRVKPRSPGGFMASIRPVSRRPLEQSGPACSDLRAARQARPVRWAGPCFQS